MKQLITLIAFCVAGALVLDAQVVTTIPQVSPKAKVMQTVGLTDIAVVYHRPSVKDREIWGHLVPYDQVWRAGANENTVIYFSDDVEVEGHGLSAGKYGLHMIPGEESWTVIFSRNHTAWGSFSYDPKDDALRVQVQPRKAAQHHEMLAFNFDDVTSEEVTCVLSWEKLSIPFGIKVNTHEVVVTSLRDELQTQAGWTWRGWHEAANYCLTNDVNLDEGLMWATRSVFVQPQTTNMITKARLKAKVKGDEANANEVILASLQSDLDVHAVTWKEYQGLANYVHQNLGDAETALAWAGKSVEMSPNMSNMMTKATILEKSGNEEKAKKLRKDAIAMGTNAELNNYGYQLLFAGKTAEAVAVFEANAEKHPNDPNVWDSLGEGYVNNGDKEKAVKALKKSLSMNPPPNVKANSIKLLKQLGVEYKDTGS